MFWLQREFPVNPAMLTNKKSKESEEETSDPVSIVKVNFLAALEIVVVSF